jgi:hypothetical protein
VGNQGSRFGGANATGSEWSGWMNEDRAKLNEHRRHVFGEDGRLVVFLCECVEPGCLASVPLTREEYDRVRPSVVLASGHEAPTEAATT